MRSADDRPEQAPGGSAGEQPAATPQSGDEDRGIASSEGVRQPAGVLGDDEILGAEDVPGRESLPSGTVTAQDAVTGPAEEAGKNAGDGAGKNAGDGAGTTAGDGAGTTAGDGAAKATAEPAVTEPGGSTSASDGRDAPGGLTGDQAETDDGAAEVVDESLAAGRAEVLHEQLEHADEISPAARALTGVRAEPGVPKPDPILVADNVSRRFGGLTAVQVEHLEVQRGTITALIGPNGAGKSTFFNLVSGFDKPSSGRWSFDGRDITGKSAYRIARMGMVRTFQLTKALTRMTALENMMLGATGQTGERFLPSLFRPAWRAQDREIEARADALLDRFNLSRMRDDFAGTMSGGQRKLLEMARAMMVDPALIMLDEPMAGVNPALTQSLLGHIQSLRDEGTTIILVEHDMDVIMSISDWIVCFAEGAVIAEGRPDDIRSNQAVVDAYLGSRRALATDVGEQAS